MSDWVKYEGPRGGRGWRNTETGDVRYQEKMPEDGKPQATDRISLKKQKPEAQDKAEAKQAVDELVALPGWFHIRGNMYGVETSKGVVSVEIYDHEGSVHLAFIGVSEKNRGKGLASEVMRKIVGLADKHGAPMDLEVDPQDEDGLSAEQLTSWYERFGFETQPYGDGTPGSPIMKRAPKSERGSSEKPAEPEKPQQESDSKPQSKVYQWALKRFKNEEHAKNFERWFGDSKVVNEDGEPIEVHHGGLGASKIETFDKAYGGQTTGNNDHGAFHFVDDLRVAQDYGRQSFIRRYQDDPESLILDGVLPEGTELSDETGAEYDRVNDLAEDRMETQSVFLKIENPLVLDMDGERVDVQRIEKLSRAIANNEFDDELIDLMPREFSSDDIETYRDEISEYLESEYGVSYEDADEDVREMATQSVLENNDIFPDYKMFDGIIINNMIDDISEQSYIVATQYIVFESSQIKSSKNNNGQFSGNNINMSTWVPYVGPRDGRGWRNVKTGDVRYQEHPPSDESSPAIEAFHGTPHDFKSFDEDRIGTGEGVNAYGWGLYFTDSRQIAEHYANGVLNHARIEEANRLMSDISKRLEAMREGIGGEYRTEEGKALKAEYDRLLDWKLQKDGKVYAVQIKPQPNEFLLWDKAIAENSKHIQNILANIKPSELGLTPGETTEYGTMWMRPNGNYWTSTEKDPATTTLLDTVLDHSGLLLYEDLSGLLGGQKQASLWLRSKGIRGIKYLDGASRSRPDAPQSYNYVVFEDDDVAIKKDDAPDIDVTQYSNIREAAEDVASEADFKAVMAEFASRAKEVKFENGEIVFSDGDSVYSYDGELRIEDAAEWINSKSEDELHGYYPNYQQQFFDDFWTSGNTVYHATPQTNIESITASGLSASDKSRGITNRHVGSAVFTTAEWESAILGTYGDTVIEIDVGRMAEDYRKAGKELPWVSEEPHYTENNLRTALAHALGADEYSPSEAYDGTAADTIIIYGGVPPEYLTVAHQPPVRMCTDYWPVRMSTAMRRPDSHLDWMNHRDHWIAYTGPRDGHGWKNILTDEIRYQKNRPGDSEQKVLPFVDWDTTDAENLKSLKNQWEIVKDDVDDLVSEGLEQSHNLKVPDIHTLDQQFIGELANRWVSENMSEIEEKVRAELYDHDRLAAEINDKIEDWFIDNKTGLSGGPSSQQFVLPPLTDAVEIAATKLIENGADHNGVNEFKHVSRYTDEVVGDILDFAEELGFSGQQAKDVVKEVSQAFLDWNSDNWDVIRSEIVDEVTAEYEEELENKVTANIFENAIKYAVENGFEFADVVNWQEELEWPNDFDLEPDDPWSVNTQRVRNLGHYIQRERMIYWASEYGQSITAKEAEEALADVWMFWKSSSTSDTAILFQIAAMDELGLNSRAKVHPASYNRWTNDLKNNESHQRMYWKYRAAARACWEANQYIMEQAGVERVRLYRGISVDAQGYRRAGGIIDDGLVVVYKFKDRTETLEFAKIRSDIPIAKATLNSFSSQASVANNWGSSNVKLRADVEREAIISSPVFGVNYHNETEYVVMGTKWNWWDAWLDKAPDSSKVPGNLPDRTKVTIDTQSGSVTTEPLPPKESTDVQQSIAS